MGAPNLYIVVYINISLTKGSGKKQGAFSLRLIWRGGKREISMGWSKEGLSKRRFIDLPPGLRPKA
jgi:hypothetical protein